MEKINNIDELFNSFMALIPEGFSDELEIGDYAIMLTKEDGIVSADVYNITNEEDCEESFDDSEIKRVIKEYKVLIEELDEDLFKEFCTELGKKIDLEDFNCFTEQESFTEEEADLVKEMIETAIEVVQSILMKNIKKRILDFFN